MFKNLFLYEKSFFLYNNKIETNDIIVCFILFGAGSGNRTHVISLEG